MMHYRLYKSWFTS